MRRVAMVALPLVALGAVVAAVVVLRRKRRRAREAELFEDPVEAVRRDDLPEAIGEPAEELREVHDHVAAMPRRGPEEAEAESRTRPSGLTLYDELREDEETQRHEALEQLVEDLAETRQE
jgi:cell division septation protein DedD